MEKIKIGREVANKFNLDPKRESTDSEGNIVLNSDPFWADCFIYRTEDLENDAAHYLKTQIPSLSQILIPPALEVLKYYHKRGYRKFYQAIRYRGMRGKYDEENSCALCLLCKQMLLASNQSKGNAPMLDIIDPQGTLDPIIVFVTCEKCNQRLETEGVDGHYNRDDLKNIRKEQTSILFSDQTRWVMNNRKVESPYNSSLDQ